MCLKEILLEGKYSQNALKEWSAKDPPLESRDKKLFWELVLGTLRWMKRIDLGLSKQVKRYKKLPEEVKILLRVGYYQIVILDRIPPYSAVNETVEVAKQYLPRKFHKFTNAVLRKAARIPYPTIKDEENPVEAAAKARSHPKWLVERWKKRFGIKETLKLLRANLKPAPYSVWVNVHHTAINAIRKQLRNEGIECRPLKNMEGEMLEILSTVDVVDHPLYREGLIVPQDLASCLVAKVVDPKPGEWVLDACAAPGIKTAQIALAMQNRGRVVACEVNPERFELLKENILRLGAAIVEPVFADVIEKAKEFEENSFDKVLVDAPCSDLGTVRRRPEIKWKRTQEDVENFAQKQMNILQEVKPLVKIGGEIIYSVCSFEEEETLKVVEAFLKDGGFEPVNFSALLPEAFREKGRDGTATFMPHETNTDGFFIFKARRVK